MKIFQWFPFGKVARNTYLIFAAPLYLLPISLLLMSFTLWLQIDTEFLNTLINYGGILAQGFLLLATPGRLRDIGCNLLTGILLFCLMATGLGLEILDVVSPLPDWTALLWLVSTGAFYFCLAPAAGEERTYFYTPLLRFRDFVGTSSPAEFFMWHMFLLDVSLYLIVCVFVLNLLPVAVFYIAAGILVLPTLSLTIRRVRDCGEGRFFFSIPLLSAPVWTLVYFCAMDSLDVPYLFVHLIVLFILAVAVALWPFCGCGFVIWLTWLLGIAFKRVTRYWLRNFCSDNTFAGNWYPPWLMFLVIGACLVLLFVIGLKTAPKQENEDIAELPDEEPDEEPDETEQAEN